MHILLVARQLPLAGHGQVQVEQQDLTRGVTVTCGWKGKVN